MTRLSCLTRHRVVAAAIAMIAMGCARQAAPPDAETAYSAMRESYDATEDSGEKAALAEDYLSRFPATERSSSLAWMIAYHRGEVMGDPGGAFERLQAALAQISDPELRFAVTIAMVGLSYEIGQPLDLAAIANDLASHRELKYPDHLEIMELAVEHGAWAVAEEHATRAIELADGDTFRADYPDETFSDELVAERAAMRKLNAVAHRAWAMANTGRAEEAVALFEETAPLEQHSYLGSPQSPLLRFWGLTELERGNPQKAVELLETLGVLGGEAADLEALRSAFVAVHDDGDFNDYLWSARQRLARPIDDFTLADYKGARRVFSQLRQDKVTFLTFWFPT